MIAQSGTRWHQLVWHSWLRGPATAIVAPGFEGCSSSIAVTFPTNSSFIGLAALVGGRDDDPVYELTHQFDGFARGLVTRRADDSVLSDADALAVERIRDELQILRLAYQG